MGGTKRNMLKKDFLTGDLSADFESEPVHIIGMDRVGFNFKWDGDPTGDFGVQISNDIEDDSSWVDMTLSAPVAAAGAPDTAFIDAETAGAYMRLVYTSTSGSGNLIGTVSSKSISG